ncbi:MAG: hypothetical protein RLZZ234_506 [Candidatus Parcubacteria bacterium]|jgi:hypothetical protein
MVVALVVPLMISPGRHGRLGCIGYKISETTAWSCFRLSAPCTPYVSGGLFLYAWVKKPHTFGVGLCALFCFEVDVDVFEGLHCIS